MLTLLMLQFYPPYQCAALLPKQSAPVPIGFHLILQTDYFNDLIKKSSYQGWLGPNSRPLCVPLRFGLAVARYQTAILHDVSGSEATPSDADILDTRAYGMGRS